MSTGLGSSKKGSRIADSSMFTRFRRTYVQGLTDASYINDSKKNSFKTTGAVLNTFAFGSANATLKSLVAPPDTSPNPPIIESIVTGNGLIVIVFSAPSFDGGRPITGYEYSLNNGATFTSTESTTSPIIVTGLTNGTPYSVTIRAVNGLGSSSDSNIVVATPNVVIQGFTTVGTTSWTAPAGITVVSYLVVGGGGGAGNGYDNGGGGGAGGGMVRSGVAYVVPGTSYTITVGAGGAGGANIRSDRPGAAGTGSMFGSITALGGGGGKGSRTIPYTGAGVQQVLDPPAAPTGGSGSGSGAGGKGGGGSGGNGSANSGSTGGSGGIGLSSAITGSSVTYGAGGSGANSGSSNGGTNLGASNSGTGGNGGGAGSGASVGGGNGQAGIVVLTY